jgi:hypothetical protein
MEIKLLSFYHSSPIVRSLLAEICALFGQSLFLLALAMVCLGYWMKK